MNKIVVKKGQFSKNSVEPFTPSANPLFYPLQKENFKPKSSFNSELKKITAKIGPVLEKNLLKFENNRKANSVLFKIRARSSSPRKDLTLEQKNLNLFPCGMPIIPVFQKIEEDEELKRIKEDYLSLIGSVEDKKPEKSSDFWDEEEAYIEEIINSMSFIDIKKVIFNE